MAEITFIYMNNKYKISMIKKNSNFDFAIDKFLSLMNGNFKDLLFLYNGKNISKYNTKKVIDLKNNKLNIFVFNKKINKNIEIREINCPQCDNLAIANYNDNKISIENCKYNHKISNISINLFIYLRNKNKIRCFICNNYKSFYNIFYYCSCNEYICPLCKDEHIQKYKHNIIEYNKRLNICYIHNNEFISYCNICKLNLCPQCEASHYNHKIIYYKEIKPGEKKLNEIKKEANDYKSIINQIINNFKYLNKSINNYINKSKSKLIEFIKLYDIILASLDNINNYENINNINNLKVKIISKDINNFIEDFKNKTKFLNEDENKQNETMIIYNNYKKDIIIRLFGEKFVKNNKNRCYLLINNRKYELQEYYMLKDNEILKQLIIKLIQTKDFKNMSEMFYNCYTLIDIPNISKWNTKKVRDISKMFYNGYK